MGLPERAGCLRLGHGGEYGVASLATADLNGDGLRDLVMGRTTVRMSRSARVAAAFRPPELAGVQGRSSPPPMSMATAASTWSRRRTNVAHTWATGTAHFRRRSPMPRAWHSEVRHHGMSTAMAAPMRSSPTVPRSTANRPPSPLRSCCLPQNPAADQPGVTVPAGPTPCRWRWQT